MSACISRPSGEFLGLGCERQVTPDQILSAPADYLDAELFLNAALITSQMLGI